MTGENLSTACPACGSPIESIQDCFSGPASQIDNFDEVEPDLRERDLLTDDLIEFYDSCFPHYSTDEIRNESDSLSRDPSEAPFITDSIVTTESWCTSDNCDFSQRIYRPPTDTTFDIDDYDLSNLSDEARREAELLFEELSS